MHFFTFDRLWAYSCSLFFVLLLCNCSQEEPLPLNEVTPKDDEAIGYSIDAAYMDHLDTLPDEHYLSDANHPDLYVYLHDVCKKIQQSSAHAMQSNRDIPMRRPILRVLESPSKTSAFVAPGGHIYIYTGLLKAMSQEAELVPVLAHLLNCSLHRLDVKKLENHFSTNFLLDLAIGSNVNGSSYASAGTNVCAVIEHLAEKPYHQSDVTFLDEKAETITCELGYDIQVYSNFYTQNSIQDLDWFTLFPRGTANHHYADHLSNSVQDSLTCGGTMTTGGYADFKTLIP